MARPEFETVVASAPRERMIKTDLSTSVSVAAGATVSTFVYAPTGYIATLKGANLIVPAPAGAASGTHLMNFGYNGIAVTGAKSNYNSEIRWANSFWITGDVYQQPPTTQTQNTVVSSVDFDDVIPLEIFYSNNTNVAQNGNRSMLVVYKLRQVAK